MLLFAVLLALLNGAARGDVRVCCSGCRSCSRCGRTSTAAGLSALGVLGLWSAGALVTQDHLVADGCRRRNSRDSGHPGHAVRLRALAVPVGDRRTWTSRHRRVATAHRACSLIPWGAVGLAGCRGVAPARAGLPRFARTRGGLGLLALRVARLEGFFALAAVMLLAPCFAGLGPQRLPLSRRPTRAETACRRGDVSRWARGDRIRGEAQRGCVTITSAGVDETRGRPKRRPSRSCSDNPLQGRLLTCFDYGEIGHLASCAEAARVVRRPARDGVLRGGAGRPQPLLLERGLTPAMRGR